MPHTLSQPAVDAVIFDLGRVLIDYDWNPALQKAGQRLGLPLDEIRRRLFPGPLFVRFELGELAPLQFHAELAGLLGGSLPYAEFRELWNSIFTREIAALANLASALRRAGAVRVAILSNTNALHVEYLRHTFPWLREWEHVYMSNEIGLRKPDPAAFRHVLEQLQVQAGRAAFVDDMPENIAAAERVGMRGVLVRSPEEACAELARLGIRAEEQREST